ncbi:endonuclease domain-containing protein, partial [Pelomicrobium sp. G1]|uniref:endonuclease domain-containing protein n=1 Tax=Pelomicrobium sp. G1 TaxID=3452920 RepID=UPI003F76A813
AGEGREASLKWLEQVNRERASRQTRDTAIEKALLQTIREAGRLPEPVSQYEIKDETGKRITIPDFAYPERRIAIYCDGFTHHGNRDTLESDARKRNALQAMGWAVLNFWGRQILRDAAACERQIWQCYQFRKMGP